ncbi:MAG: hypothetical protein SFZ03_12205 [Candidatus Melainabacteria bacterium]|nr:hypothetical protein [Candidatus Melainabacteria bacterium]
MKLASLHPPFLLADSIQKDRPGQRREHLLTQATMAQTMLPADEIRVLTRGHLPVVAPHFGEDILDFIRDRWRFEYNLEDLPYQAKVIIDDDIDFKPVWRVSENSVYLTLSATSSKQKPRAIFYEGEVRVFLPNDPIQKRYSLEQAFQLRDKVTGRPVLGTWSYFEQYNATKFEPDRDAQREIKQAYSESVNFLQLASRPSSQRQSRPVNPVTTNPEDGFVAKAPLHRPQEEHVPGLSLSDIRRQQMAMPWETIQWPGLDQIFKVSLLGAFLALTTAWGLPGVISQMRGQPSCLPVLGCVEGFKWPWSKSEPRANHLPEALNASLAPEALIEEKFANYQHPEAIGRAIFLASSASIPNQPSATLANDTDQETLWQAFSQRITPALLTQIDQQLKALHVPYEAPPEALFTATLDPAFYAKEENQLNLKTQLPGAFPSAQLTPSNNPFALPPTLETLMAATEQLYQTSKIAAFHTTTTNHAIET